MNGPVCSVVMPAYNVAEVIGEALDSLLNGQTSEPFEIIVVDDGSTDATAAVVRGYGDRVRLLSQPNSGPASARNHGVRAARSDLILFLDADDRALPGRIARQIAIMRNDPSIAMCCGNWLSEAEDGDRLAVYGMTAPKDGHVVLRDPLGRLLVRGCFVITSTVAIRRDVYVACGMQPEGQRYAEDYALWCRIAAGGGRIAVAGAPLAWYRRARPGRLSLLPHTYTGPVYVVRDMLLRHGAQLAADDRAAALARFQNMANALLRHDWAYGGRGRVLARLDAIAPLDSAGMRRKWRLLTMIPGVVPKLARAALHRLRRVRMPLVNTHAP